MGQDNRMVTVRKTVVSDLICVNSTNDISLAGTQNQAIAI